MNYSASQLVKQSASQTAYLLLKKQERKVTDRMYRGNIHSEQVASKEQASSEKRGIIPIGDDIIFFCVDMVKDNLLAEVKLIEGTYEDWFLKSSILQTSYYATLCKRIKHLDTPKFRKKEGYIQEIIHLPKNWRYELWFGKEKYSIQPCESLYKHYLNKIDVINDCLETSDFTNVRAFDSKYKWKEFDIFKPKYSLLNKSLCSLTT